MSRLLEYLKPLQQFVQQSPMVFWSTLVLSALVILLFVVLPSEQSDDKVPARETAERLVTAEAGSGSSEHPDTSSRIMPVDRDRTLEETGSVLPARAPDKFPPQNVSAKRGSGTDSDRRSGGFTVQVGSFASEESAQLLSRKLEASGYPVFVKAARVPGTGLTYRVRVGAFATRKEAQRFGNQLVADEESVKSVFATIND